MKKQMLIFEDEQMVHWRIPCQCGIREHDIELTIIKDEEGEIYNWVDLRTQMFADSFWERIKEAFSILFRGRTTDKSEVFLFDEENIESFIDALKKSAERIKEI